MTADSVTETALFVILSCSILVADRLDSSSSSVNATEYTVSPCIDIQLYMYVTRRTTSLEQSAAKSQTMWAVIRPVQAVTKGIFIRAMRPRRICGLLFLTAPNRNILTYLFTYLLTYLLTYISPT